MERAVFVFGGQGPEWWGMGRELFAREPVFADVIRACDGALEAIDPGRSIERELHVAESESHISDVEVLQPFLFAVHAGIVAVLNTLGVTPIAVVGHSFGELSAAYAAGAISLEDAMRVHVARSRVMKRLAHAGRMAVVETGEERALRAIRGLEDRLAVGVINSPQSVVLSGEQGALKTALAALASEGIGHREIRMPYPVHGPQMRAVMDEVTALLAAVHPRTPAMPLFSTVTGGEGGDFDARHWARNIGEQARFGDAIDAILARGWSTFVEIGPHPTLGGAIAQCASKRGVDALVLPSLRRQRPELATLRETVETLAHGASAGVSLVTEATLVARVRALVGQHLDVAADSLEPLAGFGELGLESASAVEIAAALARDLKRPLPATLLFEHPSINALVSFLLVELGLAARVAMRPERDREAGEPIAIVGIGCRFPGGVDGPESFWRLLADGIDAVTEVPASRWDVGRLFDPDPNAPGKTYSKWGGFLDPRHDGRDFDAAFFGISPREAQSMDPQQRLLLEVAWEAFEHAGLDPQSLVGSRTGVFVGLCTGDYGGRVMHAADPRELDAYTFTGNSPSVAAGRLSYVLGLEGPALVVDTACSSSLVALHLACRSLRSRESDLALAGGVNLMLSPTLHIYFSRLRAMSPTGRSRAFDAAADGYVRGEGCGLVALKRLSDARAAGDRVLAIVRGTAVNQDGRSSGLTAPNGLAQQAVVREALRDAGIAPARVGYVEAHGTGTPLGDPIELRAIAAVLSEGRSAEIPFVVGSVKTNIGHTEGAAGIAGIIKASLVLGHARIPRSLHFREPNPHVQWSEIPAKVAAESLAWEADAPRVAGVSSFGFSGTNAHIVLEEAPAIEHTTTGAVAVPVLLSARTDEGLRAQADRLREHLERHPELSVVDIAATLATARTQFARRSAFVAGDAKALIQALAAVRADDAQPAGALAFLFTGQGSQRVGMGRVLHAHFSVFREAFDAVLDQLDPQVRHVVWNDAGRLDGTGFAQPALFALEVALFRLFESWGVKPAFLAGHSVGEISAAHVAGVLSLPDACTLVAARGRLMQALPAGGAMVSLEATADEVRPLIAAYPGEIDLASINGPRSVVISGDEGRVLDVAAQLEAMGRRTARLTVSHAFHSPRLEPMLADLRAVAAGLTFHAPQVPIVSTLTGKRVDPSELASPDYWVRQARGAVDFAGALRTLASEGAGTFLELGPQGVLSALGSSSVADATFVPAIRRDQSEDEAIAGALAQIHLRGVAIEWGKYFASLGARRVSLPTYAFQRRRHWIEEPAATRSLLGDAVPLATGGLVLNGCLSLAEQPWLAGHAVFGTVILPGTAFLELALTAARHAGFDGVEELVIEAPLAIPREGAVDVQVAVDGRRAISVHARAEGGAWTRHASGTLGSADPAVSTLGAWPPSGAEAIPLDGLYERLEAAGLSYGDRFRRVSAAWKRGSELFVEVAGGDGTHQLDPMLLDAALHLLVRESLDGGHGLALPFSWSGAALRRAGATALRVRIARQDRGVTLEVADENGELVAKVAALETRPAVSRSADNVYRLEWKHVELPPAVPSRDWAIVGAPFPGLSANRFADVAALVRDGFVPSTVFLHSDASEVRTAVRETLATLQQLLTDARFDKTPMVLLTRGAVAAVPGDTVSSIAGASAAGLLRSARSEYPSRVIRNVDLDEHSLPALAAALASGESELALRAGAAWTPRLARAEITRELPPRLSDGTVLITGGTGALGACVARHLVSAHGARDLLLVSRRGEAAPGAEALRTELAAAGARVVLAACDVADTASLQQMLATVGPLRGIVHAAGVLDDGVLASIDPARLDRVFAPKVDAALAIDGATRDQPLAFFVLFSSVAGLFGPTGQGAYAAANAALDAIAWRRRAEGKTATSINFGPWRAGMAAQLAGANEKRVARYGMVPLSTESALAALDAAIGSSEAQVAAVALKPVAEDAAADVPAIWRHLVVRASPRPRVVATTAVEPAAMAIPEVVRSEIARVLGLGSASDVSWDAAFRDLGMDSLVAVELRNALSRRLDISLPATLVFDFPNPRALSRALADRLAPPAPPDGAPGIDDMSEHQLDDLLASLQSGTDLQ